MVCYLPCGTMLASQCSVSGRGVKLFCPGHRISAYRTRCKEILRSLPHVKQTSSPMRTWALVDAIDADLEIEREPCYPAYVYMDNKSTESYTEFTVEVYCGSHAHASVGTVA